MTPMRPRGDARTTRRRAAALALSVVAVTGLAGAACSSSDGSLPPMGTQAPNSPPGSLPDLSTLPVGSLPSPSGDASACAGPASELTVRTASGEERTITPRSSWALYSAGAPTWTFVSSDADLPADNVRSSLPDPAGKTLVVMRLVSTSPTTQLTALAAGDRFAPSGTSAPNGKPAVDVQVRTAAGDAASTGPLTGTLTVDAVTNEGVCLSVDLHRDSGSQVEGHINAPYLSVNQAALTS